MPHIIEITDLSAPELDVFARLTEAQLRSRRAPERAPPGTSSPAAGTCPSTLPAGTPWPP